jgi:hypothetical protein
MLPIVERVCGYIEIVVDRDRAFLRGDGDQRFKDVKIDSPYKIAVVDLKRGCRRLGLPIEIPVVPEKLDGVVACRDVNDLSRCRTVLVCPLDVSQFLARAGYVPGQVAGLW